MEILNGERGRGNQEILPAESTLSTLSRRGRHPVLLRIDNKLVKNKTYYEFRAFLRASCRPSYPRSLLLVLIARLVPIGSAECEQVFSLMNRIKSELRSRMRTDRIFDIMAVIRLAPGLITPTLEWLDEWISFCDSGSKAGRYTSYHK